MHSVNLDRDAHPRRETGGSKNSSILKCWVRTPLLRLETARMTRRMLERAALGIAVLGPEGVAGITLQKADVVVPDIRSALELLLYPKRLIATLRR